MVLASSPESVDYRCMVLFLDSQFYSIGLYVYPCAGTTLFIAALFTIARTWKQPKCPLTDKWVKKLWYIYTMECYSAIKKPNNAIFSNMDGPGAYHTKWSKSDRERQLSYDTTFRWNLNKWYKWTYLQNRKRLTDLEDGLVVARGEESEGMDWEFGIHIYTLLCVEQMANGNLLCSEGSSAPYSVVA